jgi:(2Fe-2S) ferredoxin
LPSTDQYYQHHLFFCTNKREGGISCASRGSVAIHQLAKKVVSDLDPSRSIKIRVNSAGCLGRCNEGPVLVVYPTGAWYTYKDVDDFHEIINEHILHGRIVERLRL